jgi:hypothetical protein
MPKDPARNQPNYKIGGSHLNEFEFNQQHGAMTEEERHPFPGQHETPGLPGEEAPQETEAERVARLMEEARAIVAKRRGARGSSGAKKSGAAKKPAGAKKSGAKPDAGKGAAKKSPGAKKGTTKRGAAKTGTKKVAKKSAKKTAKKSGGAKGSQKRGARGR